MKIFKKVKTIEVKRCFVISQLIRRHTGKKRFLGLISKKEFEKKLVIAKKKGLKFSEKQLDEIINNEYAKRLKAYDNSDWYIGEFKPIEVGVWNKAGGLPTKWTSGSLSLTSKYIKDSLDKNLKKITRRAGRTISHILKTNISHLKKEKYLFPIVFKGNTGTKGRHRLKNKMKGDIDDGCMRSIALVISGVKIIKAYIGFPKK